MSALINSQEILEEVLKKREDYVLKRVEIGLKKAVLSYNKKEIKNTYFKYLGFDEENGKIRVIEEALNNLNEKLIDLNAFKKNYDKIKSVKKYSTKEKYFKKVLEALDNSELKSQYEKISKKLMEISSNTLEESIEKVKEYMKYFVDEDKIKKLEGKIKLMLDKKSFMTNDNTLLGSIKRDFLSESRIGSVYENINPNFRNLIKKLSDADIIDNYVMHGKTDSSLADLLENIELSIGNQLSLNSDESLKKYLANIVVSEDYEKNNVNKIIETNNEDIISVLNGIELSKSSFEKIYVKGNKTRVLKDVIRAVLSNNCHDNFLAREVMEMIESRYDFITFSDSNSNDKIFINKGTFSSIWSSVKKELNSNTYYSEAPSIEKTLLDIITESDTKDIHFEALEKDELLRFIPDYDSLKALKTDGEDNVLKDLSPIFEEELEYSKIVDEKLKKKIYSKRLFKKIEIPFKNEVIRYLPKDSLVEFCNNYKDKMALKYNLSKNNTWIDNVNEFSLLSHKLLGVGSSEQSLNLFGSKVKSFISATGNSHEQLTLSKLKKDYAELVGRISSNKQNIPSKK